jgi:acyl carrier protein
MKEKIKDFILQTFMFGEGTLKDKQPLFESGLIDSLGFLKLLAFIEKNFGISFDMKEIAIENFNTVEDIVKTLEKKMKKK